MEILSATDLLITDQRMLSQLKFKQLNHLESSFRQLKVSAVSSAATDVDQIFSSICRVSSWKQTFNQSVPKLLLGH